MSVSLTVLLFSSCVFYVGKVMYCVRLGGGVWVFVSQVSVNCAQAPLWKRFAS